MFDFYISLGYFCGTAASLFKLGYRSFSGPFDWCFSDFESVLKLIENDFVNFMKKENLEILENYPKQFIDNIYGIHFNHEIKTNIDDDYENINHKYKRRINKFLEATKSPTCFFRAVRNQEEIKYIFDNEDYILSTIKKNNCYNKIVFLVPPSFDDSILNKTKFEYFKLNNRYDGSNYETLMSMLDKTPEILDYLSKNYSLSLKEKNIKFYKNKIMITQYKKRIAGLEYRYNLAIRLLNTDFKKDSLPNKIVIYGIGKIGKAFYKKIKSLCDVVAFIETSSEEDVFDNKKIYTLQNLEKIACNNYIITPIHDFEVIEKQILKIKPSANIISLDKILVNNC